MANKDNAGAIKLIGLWGKTYEQKLGKDPKKLCKDLMKQHGIARLQDLNKEQAFDFLRIFMDEIKRQNHAKNEAKRKIKGDA